ncbi:hypothetical protein GCM10009558_012000 [Virgisporangium aurantiacum]
MFLRLLAAALAAQPALRLLLAMRPELLATATEVQPRLIAHPIPIGPLGPNRIRDAIVLPANAAGVRFENGLLEVMVAEATVGDALPLLGLLLERLFEEAADGVVTNAQYDRAGRVGGAIASHADGVYRALIDEHPQDAVEGTLLRCVAIEGNEPVRTPVFRSSLDEISSRVMAELRASRLVVDVNDGAAFELAHDALFRQWTTLADLVTRNAQRLRQFTLLEHRATAWAANPVADELLRGQALDRAAQVITNMLPSPSLAAFFAASRSADSADLSRRADHAASWAQQVRERDHDLAVAIVMAAVRELTASPAAKLTLWGLTPTGDTWRLPVGHTATVTSIVWLPASGGLRSVDGSGVVCTWREDGELERIHRIGGARIGGEARLNDDGTYALVAEGHDAVGLWRVSDERYLGNRGGFGVSIDTFSWSSDGRFAGQYDFREIDVYSVQSTPVQHICRIPVEHVRATSWSPQGDMLAIATGDSLKVFTTGSVQRSVLSVQTVWSTPSIAWSPDGSRLAVTAQTKSTQSEDSIFSSRRLLRIYHVGTNRLEGEWELVAGKAMAWAPEGEEIAYVPKRGRHSYVGVRDVSTGAVLRRRRRRDEPKTLSWSVNGARLAFADSFHGAEIWDLAANTLCHLPCGKVDGVSWSPDGMRAVVGNSRIPPRIVGSDASSTALLHDGRAWRFRWSPCGRLIAGANRTMVHLWDAESGVRVGTLGPETAVRRRRQRRSDSDLSMGSFEWSPDGIRITVSISDFFGHVPTTVRVWDATTRQVLSTMTGDGPLGGPLTWSSDAELLAGSIGGGDIAVWRADTGVLELRLRTGHDRANRLRWSPATERLAAVFADQVEIWNPVAGQLLARCVGHASSIDTVCWSPDGHRLATIAGHTLYLWQSDDGKPLATLDLPRLATVRDLRWTGSLTATFDDGMVTTWDVPSESEPPALPASDGGRSLTEEERRRFGLPTTVP